MIARRAAVFREREEALRGVLAEYFQARERADAVRASAESAVARVRREAEARIAQVRERAEREAAGFEDVARSAVGRMLELGESRRAVAQATGLSAAQVRGARGAGGDRPGVAAHGTTLRRGVADNSTAGQ